MALIEVEVKSTPPQGYLSAFTEVFQLIQALPPGSEIPIVELLSYFTHVFTKKMTDAEQQLAVLEERGIKSDSEIIRDIDGIVDKHRVVVISQPSLPNPSPN